MEFRLLGPLEAREGDRVVPLPRRQQRALLAALLVRAGEVVSVDRLVDELWGDHPPASAVGSLQNAVSQLRKALGSDVVRTQPPGYVLAVEPDQVDARRFERLLVEAARAEPAARAAVLREALALWRGPALADLADQPWAEQEAARLEELRLAALEERIEAELELGGHVALVAQLEALTAEHPLRERLRRQLALALYRSGRQAEALHSCRAARAALDELGLEPSAELRALERDILQQSPALAAPAATREEATPEVPGERRVVSVLAASIAADEDPEALRATLARVLEATQAAVGRHGGRLERFGAEGLTAVFGADGSHEDDALRAVRAAVELHESAGVAAAVATGEAIVTQEGQVAGAALARAAGLARNADGTLVDPRTVELVRDSATIETAGPLARVLSVDAGRPAERADTPFVGRDEELARLRDAFAAAASVRGCVAVTVVGEAGIGKTRLARELVRSLDAAVLVGRCAAYGEGATFLPVVDALAGIDTAAVLAGSEDVELVARRVEQLRGAAKQPGSLGETYWAVRRLLETLTTQRPVLLLLDDVHWAEPALLDLVEYLTARVTAAPLFVLCLARPELLDERPGWTADALRLAPLPEEQTRELVEATAELEDDARTRIVELAEGNPLYAQQLAAYAAESGKALEPGAMPATIDAVLAGRLGRLEAGERATLQRAAVVGREFSRGAVAALAPPDLAVDAHLLALTRRGLVRPTPDPLPGDDAYRFHHVLLRDAAYATLTKEQRADLHEQAAAWLDRDGQGDDAIVGFHLEQAALLRRELGVDDGGAAAEAGERLSSAGVTAWSRGDVTAATALLSRSAALLPEGRRRAETLFELGVALTNAGRLQEATRAIEAALHQGAANGDRRTEARARVELANTALLQGTASVDEVLAVAAQEIAVLETIQDFRGLGRAWLHVAAFHGFRCDYEAAADAADRAIRHYRRAGFSAAAALATRAGALFYGSTPVHAAVAVAAELRELAPDRASEANVVNYLGALMGLAGDFDEARRLTDSARAVYVDVGMTLGIETMWAPLRMEVERLSGDLDSAARIGRRSVDRLLELDATVFAATRAAQLAEIELTRGKDREAQRLVALSKRHSVRHDTLMQMLNPALEARLLARRRESGRAERLARRAVRVGERTDALGDRVRTLVALADVLLLDGRSDEAAVAVEDARRLLIAKGSTSGVAQLDALFARASAA